MTVLSQILSFFPTLHGGLIAASFFGCVIYPSWSTGITFLFFVYGFPLCVFRLVNVFVPLQEGEFHLDKKCYSPWWGAYQIQSTFIAIPWLESILRNVPGLFSLWLRLWGSKVGKSVHWTPIVEIADRSLLTIGDAVIFGYKVECYGHIVTPKNGCLLLYVKRIIIEKGVFLGAGSRLGPGVKIESGARIPLLTDCYPDEIIRRSSTEDAS
jgi:hypothetical protein